MKSPLSIGVRRFVLGVLALVAFLAAVGHGITYDAGGLAWLAAVGLAPLTCFGVLRLGNPRWLFVGRSRYDTRMLSRADPRLIAAMACLGTFSLVHAVLPNAWQVAWWAVIFGGLAGYTISPPARPTSLGDG